MITEEQIDKIINRVEDDQLSNLSLRDDLVDHLCCLVETKIESGQTFESAYEEAFTQTTPNGCQEIEHETYLLINYKKILMMKKFTYTLGFLFTLIFVFGATFKIINWPGADLFMLIGGTGNAILFIPLLLLHQHKEKVGGTVAEKGIGVLASLGLAMILWFKFMSWQGVGELIALEALVIGFGVLPLFFFKLYKRSMQNI